MTTDPAKFPRAQPLPKRSALDAQIDSTWHYFRMSATDETRRRYAGDLVDLKHQRGDYELGTLDAMTRTALVKQLMLGEADG